MTQTINCIALSLVVPCFDFSLLGIQISDKKLKEVRIVYYFIAKPQLKLNGAEFRLIDDSNIVKSHYSIV